VADTYLDEQLVSKALGYYVDPEFASNSGDDRAAVASLNAGIEIFGSSQSLRELGFDPWKTGDVVIKLADQKIQSGGEK
jgi:hypothetical protein